MKLKNISILQWNLFNSYPVKTGVTTREGGVSLPPYQSMNLAKHTGDKSCTVDENRKILAEFLDSDLSAYTHVNQVHGDSILKVTKNNIGINDSPCDAIITNIKGVLLNIFVADCVPIVIYDTCNSVVGICHCGWKGTYLKLLTKTIDQLKKEYDSDIKDLLIGIGPSIGICCYNVSKDLYMDFNPTKSEGNIKDGKYFLNLKEINKNQAVEAGISPQNIELMDLCTSCNNESFYSHRKEGEPSGRFSAFIEITS